jgi:hypothetical protein
MLVDMKGIALAWGSILAVLLVASFVIVGVVGKGTFSQTIIVKSGAIISFVNNAEMIMRTFNASIIPISQRAAYDLGKIGGSDKEIWTDKPSLDELKYNLKSKISENLPSDVSSDGRVLIWLESNLTIIPCEPLESSKCFIVKGWKKFSFYDSIYDTTLIVNNSFDQTVPSSYFKLAYVARQIVDKGEYITKSTQQLYSEYRLQFSKSLDNGVYTITITDNTCLPNNFYCLAPLKAEENKKNINGQLIPFDYLSLTFKVK